MIYNPNLYFFQLYIVQKFRIRETPTLSTYADSRTNSNLKRLYDISKQINPPPSFLPAAVAAAKGLLGKKK